MSRTKRSTSPVVKSRHPELVKELASELKADRDCGQPMIDEESFPRTGLLKVTVVWDAWQSVPDDERSKVILESYRQAEGDDYARRITLASGLTIPEAYASGLLPFQIVPFVRDGDPVTLDDCKRAMIEEGASLLLDPESPQLRFSTEEAALAARERLAKRLPGSEPVWGIIKDVFSVDRFSMYESS
jgi:hypothetical protein